MGILELRAFGRNEKSAAFSRAKTHFFRTL
jgi:hypothetical protein